MEYKPLPVGVDNFEKLITKGYYLVDKTLLIKELLDRKSEVSLFTRPRRFGKTLNMSMLRYFFEDARDREGNKKDYSHLFEGLGIMEAGEKYTGHMGKYPVISLSLKSGKQPEFEMAYASLKDEIQQEFQRHRYVLDGAVLDLSQKQRFEELWAGKADRIEYAKSLQFLSQCLELYYGERTIILIDEYDVPVENAFVRGFYGEMIDFIRTLFESAFKTNGSLEFAVITGCLRISKESIFTGMNNLKIISILSEQYDEYFGFTEEEVGKICSDYGMPQKYAVFQEWYNGYVFGSVNVYNPWSVIQFTDDLVSNINCYPSSYWANTSSNSIVRSLIDMADEDTRNEIEALIEGQTLVKPVHEDITYDEVYETMDNLWNFMFFTGYFRKVSDWTDENENHFVELTIPNKEVNYIFRTKILSWFQKKVKEKDRTRLMQAVIDGDTAVMEEEISEMLMETISFNDAYESFYHGFLVGILAGMKSYRVKSNREGGRRGRSDIFIYPATRRKAAFVVELKVAESIRSLDGKALEAIRQIKDREYIHELNDIGFETVHKYGIAFCRKDCHVVYEE